ncbi:murein transglycosylase A [Sphingomonas montana]|uniref:murein transglycosylase A n=1 Tax=Sphingomonas montana TaxID=1843236 RepID=UPI00096F5347|nr:murein transglycosylase A [Sphingomonas montana]
MAGCAGPQAGSVESAPAPSKVAPSVESERLPAPTSLTPGPRRVIPRAVTPPVTPPYLAPDAVNAAGAGVRAGPAFAALGATEAEAQAALAAFRISCPSLVRRTDRSGLTRPADWTPACTAAAGWGRSDALGFFARYLEPVTIGSGQAFATGYYEPEIAGSRTRQPGYAVPIYGRPADLVDVDLGQFAADLKGRKIRGQVKDGTLGLYPDRAAIVAGGLGDRAPVVAWAKDPIEMFFLQVQGSGLLRLPDGGIMRVGYATQNGRDYTGIGKYMKDRGLFATGQSTSMQGIIARLRQEPDGGTAIMNANKSFVFFRELGGAGPLGAMGYPVMGRTTVAADPAFTPLGAPLFLAMDHGEASGLWVAQDTGGAIKGANRFDTYWGSGAEARTVAGGMSARGQAWLLLPIGTAARLSGGAVNGEAGGAAAARP